MTAQYLVEQIFKTDKARWNQLLYNSLYPSYHQTIAYEYSKEINNRKVSTFIFTLKGEDIAGVHYSIKKSKYNLLTTADIISGFIFKNEAEEPLLRFIIEHFIGFAKKNKVSYIRINPWLPKTVKGNHTGYESLFNNVLTQFDDLTEGRHTYWIDLTKSEDELLKSMKPQTRRKIKKGIKSGLQLETYNTFDAEKVESFYQLYSKLGANKDFATLSKINFFEEVKSLMDEGAVLFFLKFQNIVVDVALTSNIGIATYYHGAVNLDYKKLEGCPPPGHYMQWVMIKHMKSKGLKTYDMAFCPGPVPQKGHPNYGMWRFKYEFGGVHVQFLPVYGKVLKPLRGRIFKYFRYKRL